MTGTHPQNRCLGYARVSTYGQMLDAQLEQLRGAGCTKIFREKVTGAHSERTIRPIAAVSPKPIPRHARVLMQPALARSMWGRATVQRGLEPRAEGRFTAVPVALALRLRLAEGRRSTAERHPTADRDLMAGSHLTAAAEGISRWAARMAVVAACTAAAVIVAEIASRGQQAGGH